MYNNFLKATHDNILCEMESTENLVSRYVCWHTVAVEAIIIPLVET